MSYMTQGGSDNVNFVFISPNYPSGHYKFVSALYDAGINVLGIGDAGYETFPAVLRGSMTEYYRVGDLHDYDAVYRACAFFIHKYGRIDVIGSLNPYWLDLEAELRHDLRIAGVVSDDIGNVVNIRKSLVCANRAGAPVTEHKRLLSLSGALRFARQCGFPIAAIHESNKRFDSFRINNIEMAEALLSDRLDCGYILCDIPKGKYISVDGLADDSNELIICTASEFSEEPGRIIESGDLLSFTTVNADKRLRALCSDMLKQYKMGRGFFHFDFVKTAENGEPVLTKAEFSPPAEYVLDGMCCALGIDIYSLWAKLASGIEIGEIVTESFTAGVCSRRFDRSYAYCHEDILNRLGAKLYYHGYTDDTVNAAAGDYIYVFRCKTEASARRNVEYIKD